MAGANSNFQLTDLDFINIKNNLKTFLKSQDTLKDYNYEGSALSTLLDILAYNTQYNAYYLNMVSNELFMDSALQRSSVVSHAKLLNYTPKSATAPQASINLTVNQVDSASLTLPKYTQFMSEAIDGVNYIFVTPEATTVNVSGGTASFSDITIKQGIPTSYNYTVDSSSNPKYTFKLPETNIDTNTLLVNVQRSISDSSYDTYRLATDILSLNSSSKVYFLQESVDGYYEIYFGDGILGKQLVDGNIVKVSYLVTSGTSSYGANSFVLMDTVGGFSNNSVTPITSATAGSGKESIASIKFQAPKSYSAQGRAVSKEDYITALQQNTLGVSFDSVNVWGGEQNDPPVYGQVFVCAKPAGAYSLTQTQKNRLIQDTIKPISVMTVEPVFVDPDYTYLQLTVDVLYDPKKTTLTSGQIQTAVKTALLNYSYTALNTFDSTFASTDFQNVVKQADQSIITNDISVKLQKKFMPLLDDSTSYKLYYNTPLKRGMFQSGITSTPSVKYRNPSNAADIINGIYIEEVPKSTGGIESITVTNPGYSYQSAPTITILGDGTGATATATLNPQGSIKTITVTNTGTGYTSALVQITPASNDTTGQQGDAIAIMEGRYGTLRLYYNNTLNVKTVFNADIGTVDYQSGIITLNSFMPYQVDNDLGQLTVTTNPVNTIISSTYNRIITVDPYDPNAIIVNVTAKT